MRCDFGTLAPGDTFEMVVQATAGPEGEHEVEAGAGGMGTFDTNIEDNNSVRRFVAGNPPPISTPSPSPSAANPAPSTSGGGGGGALDAWLLLALLGVAAYRCNRPNATNV
jgi:hypothetical protein